MVEFAIEPAHTALVNVDLQNFFVDTTQNGLELVHRINEFAESCREAGILVIHTAHVLRPDGSNIGVLGEIVPDIRDERLLHAGSHTAALHDQLHIADGDVVLEKPRFGAFYGTDLALILRSHGIDTIIITGISTDVCCDTTAREANARDFRVLFTSDGTMTNDPNPEQAQAWTLEMIGSLFGEVLTMEQVLARVARAGSLPG
jgi:nicotinamidase-related amidase